MDSPGQYATLLGGLCLLINPKMKMRREITWWKVERKTLKDKARCAGKASCPDCRNGEACPLDCAQEFIGSAALVIPAATASLLTRTLGAAHVVAVSVDASARSAGFSSPTGLIQLNNAETLFTVLGTLRGGAAKLGQALSVFEPAVPHQLIGPHREALTKLQEQLPPVPYASLTSSLQGLPDGLQIDPEPVAAASLGQVHRGIWSDGRPVAVKIQYPGIAKMIRADALQLRFLGPVLEAVFPGSKAMNIVDEHVRYLQRELDYEAEARNQRRFARAWASLRFSGFPLLFSSPNGQMTSRCVR